MPYAIKKGRKYFNSGSSFVGSAGHCDTPSWGEKPYAWVSSSQQDAQSVADLHGGEVVEY